MLARLAIVVALLLSALVAAAPPAAQCNAVRARAPCGQPTDSAALCASKGCCWNATDGGANDVTCFYAADAVPLSTVHVIQACHFDAGYADTTSNILNKWFHQFFPQALSLGLQLDALGGRERLKFLAQSWIVSLFLDCPPSIPNLVCPSPTEVANFTRAVKAGYIYWHVFPFNGEAELMSESMFAAALNLTFTLDDLFGLPHKMTLSQRDVPGMSRAVLPSLSSAGVKAITIGANPWSTPPAVPRAFMWRDAASGVSIPTMLHPRQYGGIGFDDAVIIPGFSHAIVFDWRGDNAGPPSSVKEVQGDFASIAEAFPGAEIISSTLDDFTALLTPEVTATLPVITREMGDTWLFGAASDPQKSAKTRRASTARQACIADGGCSVTDPVIANFTRLLLKNSEHTWGESIGHYSDHKNWSNPQFEAARASVPHYAEEIIASWHEQRLYGLDAPMEALGKHPLAAKIAASWAELHPQGAPSLAGWTPAAPTTPHVVGGWTIAFDSVSGAVSYLSDTTAIPPSVWVDTLRDGSFLGLAQYRTYDNTSVFAWENAYNGLARPNPEFGRDMAFSEAGAKTQVAPQQLEGLWSRMAADGVTSFLVNSQFADAALHTDYGAPSQMWTQYDVPLSGAINMSFTILDKTPTRLPEGLFLRFNTTADSWRVVKVGMEVDPFDVVDDGGLRHHGVDTGVFARASTGAALFIASPDAPLAAFGAPTIFPVPDASGARPDASEGCSFLLMDNLWNTNYPFWCVWDGEGVKGVLAHITHPLPPRSRTGIPSMTRTRTCDGPSPSPLWCEATRCVNCRLCGGAVWREGEYVTEPSRCGL